MKTLSTQSTRPFYHSFITAGGSLLGNIKFIIEEEEGIGNPRGSLSKFVPIRSRPSILLETHEIRDIEWQIMHSLRRQHERLDEGIRLDLLRDCDRLLSRAGLPVMPSRPWDITSVNIDEQLLLVSTHRQTLELHKPSASHIVFHDLELVKAYEGVLKRAWSWATFHCHWYPLFSKISSSDNAEEASEKPDKYLSWRLKDDELRVDIRERSAMLRAMRGRNQFTTNTGLIGIGPLQIQPGDKIVLFDASSFVFAIRESDSGHKLIGQVLVCAHPSRHECPDDRWWGDNRPTNFPEGWRDLIWQEFVLE